MLILPLSRQTPLAKMPYLTLGLIALTTLVFFNTWPSEKRYLRARLPGEPLNQAARRLTDILAAPELRLAPDLRSALDNEQKKILYPEQAAEDLFARADHEIQGKSWEVIELRNKWKEAYAAYQQVRQSGIDAGAPSAAPFARYAFDAERGYFPGLFTHMFLHAGFLHLFFNMFLLWIVGSSMEERWGAPLFLALYLSGGMAAALAQEVLFSVSGRGLVGASGAVAAIMGAFLIRHHRMPIKFFYWFGLQAGTAVWPAWTLLILWFIQQMINATFSGTVFADGVAYQAHIGGFLYGALIGWFILRGKIGRAHV